jgi:hypothetical protein
MIIFLKIKMMFCYSQTFQQQVPKTYNYTLQIYIQS